MDGGQSPRKQPGLGSLIKRSAHGLRAQFKQNEMGPPPVPAARPDSPDKASQHSSSGWGSSLRRIVSVGKHSNQAGPSRESLQSYLRIRGGNTGGATTRRPYLEVLSDSEVRLRAPDDASSNHLLGMPSGSGTGSSTTYAFSKVFGPQVNQAEFFESTTLPLVKDLFEGQNSLLFAYGVTASGKTYTVQGDTPRDDSPAKDPGMLPRAIDVLFNSVGHLASRHPVKPSRVGNNGVEPITIYEGPPPVANVVDPSSVRGIPTTESLAFNLNGGHVRTHIRDQTIIEASRDYVYSIWVSYAEVYNEKIYDLIDAPGIAGAPGTSQSTVQLASVGLNAANSAAMASAVAAKRKALHIKTDGKSRYISGLKEEGREILRRGQINRSVFSTLLNRTSSRSHSIFTIKVLRVARNVRADDLAGALKHSSVSRLCVVDLAGSERTRHTGTTGDRLKEAGNINKSLMVLVPYRHSKLTETFSSFFEGDGRAVMVVCINPEDTGMDENANVMQFAATAKSVTVVRPIVQHPTLPASPPPILPPKPVVAVAPEPVLQHVPVSTAPDVSILTETTEEDDDEEGAGYATAADQTDPSVIVDGQDDTEDEAEDEDDGFVDHLLDQIRSLRVQLVQQELAHETREARVRKELMDQMAREHNELGTRMAERIAEVEASLEAKWTRKLDLYRQMNEDLSGADSDEATEAETTDVETQTEPETDAPRLSTASTQPDTDDVPEPAVVEVQTTLRSLPTSPVAHSTPTPAPRPVRITRQSKAAAKQQLILPDEDDSVVADSDADTAPAVDSPRPVRSVKSATTKAKGALVASRSAALRELANSPKPRKSKAVKSSANGAATRKSTRTGTRLAVKDRVAALEHTTTTDGEGSLVIEPEVRSSPRRAAR